ncbi:peptidoglycan DD-metalloendopeptidase family protein [Streptomyces sp. ISL-96]|uniref:M23 family metallopeptidase n=1 Tax=Streptomyces sp. ISL-96 TaxID=2819191 RepID=UPI001BECF166|nr:M23 family metallopeptidase [Streptomyces sp. ISL-96]MBT2493784.1 peptidoglycan DD-metalloendopeptidase family protein [Streptomyces sp. ISL-96]
MDDQHAHAGYDGYSTGTFQADPLFGTLPAQGSHYEAGHSGQYDTTQWDATGAQQAVGYDAYGTQQHEHQQQEQPQYDATGAWPTAAYQTAAGIPAQSTGQWDSNAWNQTGQFDTSHFTTGQYDTGQYGTGHADTGQHDSGQYQTGQYETAQFTQAADDATGQWNTTPGYDDGTYDTSAYDTGAYDATAWNTGAYESAPPQQQVFYETAEFPVAGLADDTPEAEHEYAPDHAPEQENEPEPEPGPGPEPELEDAPAAATAAAATAPGSRSARRSAGSSGNSGRGRRRTPAKRSALLTVAVPSACVMGVAGIAAASVGSVGGAPAEEKKDTTKTVTAADPGSVKPVAVNNKLDTQFAALDEGVNDFADRASRTQERIDLQARQAAEKKRRAEEAARKEAARPKFALPVEQHGLSAYYGQAGINWMSVHSGIDFPVSYGTPVMAATDGTVRTQYNSAYGNMAIVTAPDGTETWYCHLSSTKIRSGSVQAGDTIAYSGNSGNSTGPHLHFEVRPGGGSAIDPLQWFRGHGLSPT